MDFILRIIFSGLIAFVPSEDGKRVTVFLLSAPPAHHAAGVVVPEHKALVLARAKSCDGHCPTSNGEVSQFLFPDAASGVAAAQSLQQALKSGAVWELAGSDLQWSIPSDGVTYATDGSSDGKVAPANAAQRADFRWVANLKEIEREVGPVDPALFSANPPAGLVVARMELTSGELSTYAVVNVDGKAAPVDFHAIADRGKPHYVRAVAAAVQAEIKMHGESVSLTEKSFADGPSRSMTLKPIDGVVEMAVLNISRPIPRRRNSPQQPGTHFARFWDLAANRLAADERPIPHPAVGQRKTFRDWKQLHPDGKKSSELLSEIFRSGRGPYDQILCPMTQYPRP